MKSAVFKALLAAGGSAVLAGSAFGQGWSDGWCWPNDPPTPPPPYSIDWLGSVIGNELMLVFLGINGTVTWGDGTDGPCFANGETANVRGRLGFMSGTLGSVQSDFDDLLAYVTGALIDVHGSLSYANLTRDGNRTLFGSVPYNFTFVGESDRYVVAEEDIDNTRVHLRIDVVGDAARVQWTLNNLGADPANLGLWYGAWTGMVGNRADATGNRFSGAQNIIGGKPGYPLPRNGERPPRTDQRYIRIIDPNRFPQVVDFMFGQTDAYGMRIENGPTIATQDANGNSDATEASEFVLGSWTFLLGAPPGDFTFPDNTQEDRYFLDEVAFIQKFPEQPVPGGQSRQVIQYIRPTWSTANYSKPYAVVVDAPRLLAPDSGGANGLTPNPFTIRVYIDNVRGFATVNEEIPLNDVKVTLILPPGFNLEPGETAMKTIANIPAREMRFIDWQVRADGEAFGQLNLRVKVDPIPGPVKFIDNTVQVSTTPRLVINQGANLITAPWIFSDSSWETVLQLQRPQDFQAYNWDPQQMGYVLSTSAERGRGTWIVATADFGSRQLGGNPQTPNDISTGAPLIQLRSGWNLIGNPYPYAFPLGQIVGVTGANNQQSFRWADLVQQGIVSGFMAYWDRATQSYKYIQGNEALMQPNTGYWIFVFTTQDFTLSFPPIFEGFLPGSNRGAGQTQWRQTDSQYRVQLVARNNASLDDQNFVGQAKDAASAKSLRMLDAPMGPTQQVNVSIEELVGGKPTRVAQSLSEAKGRKEWKVLVDVKEPGPVTITWPNIGTVPKNVRYRIVDMSNNLTRNLRQASGYTFTASEPGTREFKVIGEPGTASAAVIGSIVVNGGGRGRDASFTINYTLASAATTNVRILSASGREVAVLTRGRADRQGTNSVQWTTRDSAGRSVAPGTYRVEITAETESGERVRRSSPINVVR